MVLKKKDCKDQLQQPHFYCFVWETASTEHPTVLGEYFFLGGNTEHCVAGLVLQFVRSDVKAKNEYLGWTNDNSNYDKL